MFHQVHSTFQKLIRKWRPTLNVCRLLKRIRPKALLKLTNINLVNKMDDGN